MGDMFRTATLHTGIVLLVVSSSCAPVEPAQSPERAKPQVEACVWGEGCDAVLLRLADGTDACKRTHSTTDECWSLRTRWEAMREADRRYAMSLQARRLSKQAEKEAQEDEEVDRAKHRRAAKARADEAEAKADEAEANTAAFARVREETMVESCRRERDAIHAECIGKRDWAAANCKMTSKGGWKWAPPRRVVDASGFVREEPGSWYGEPAEWRCGPGPKEMANAKSFIGRECNPFRDEASARSRECEDLDRSDRRPR